MQKEQKKEEVRVDDAKVIIHWIWNKIITTVGLRIVNRQ
jgi:hypothetical protein